MSTELPRYKREILESGLTQKQWYRKIYLKSEHWRKLRAEKLKKCGQRCEIGGRNCLVDFKIDIHHLEYSQIYDVTLDQLQVVCRNCHNDLHGGKQKSKPIKHPKSKNGKKKMFLDFVRKITNKFDPSTEYSFMNAVDNVDMFWHFSECKNAIVNGFINMAVKKMKAAGNLTTEQRITLLSLKNCKSGQKMRNRLAKLKKTILLRTPAEKQSPAGTAHKTNNKTNMNTNICINSSDLEITPDGWNDYFFGEAPINGFHFRNG